MKTNLITRAVLLSVLLTGCGGDGVGNQADEPPIAQAGAFGSSITTTEEVTVRAGSDILLSGQNSDGVDDPILSFKWTQIDNSGYAVDLYERTSSSVVFTSPNVPMNTNDTVQLEFQLEIEDGDGATATDTIRVNVLPANDANHFLSSPQVDEKWVLMVTPSEGTILTNDVPVTITITTEASWEDRSGQLRSLVLSSKELTGTVQSANSAAPNSSEHLYFLETVPRLNADLINKHFQADDRDGRLELENVENAVFSITTQISQSAQGNITLRLARNSETGFDLLDVSNVATGLNRYSFDVNWLERALGIESQLSAENYYTCIDPANNATTLEDWLAQAGFNSAADDVVHTTYLNNYDLNFGRDMYLRQDDNGNVYSYVTNYPTLENALSQRNDFAVVAMEYSAAPTGQCGDATFTENNGGKKIVKFYAFVPDEITGGHKRAPTMNFDGRGERALPGVCISCHFGDANSDDFNVANVSSINADAADLDSSFMIWDLDSYLYTTDTNSNLADPIYAANEISTDITQAYSRAAQENAFRQQNQAVLHTFTYDPAQLKRFETPIKLLHGLYGNADQVETLNFGTQEAPLSEGELLALKESVNQLPANTFNGQYTQTGWQEQEELYHRVFARNCRLCHAQIGHPNLDFDTYDEFVNNPQLVSYVFEQGLMPLSRLTMDRFWADFYGDQSSAEFLRQHLNNDNNAGNDVAPDARPGSPVAIILPSANPDLEADIILDFDQSVLFDASLSVFSDRYQWRTNDLFESADKKFTHQAGEPGSMDTVSLFTSSSENFLSSQEKNRRILVRNNSPQVSAIPNQSANEGGTIDINIFASICPEGAADSIACRPFFGDIVANSAPIITLTNTPTNGSVTNINNTTGVVTFNSTAPEASGSAAFEFTLTDSFGELSQTIEQVININSLGGPEIIGPDVCASSARTSQSSDFPIVFNTGSCANPIDNDIAGEGLLLSLAAVDGSTLANGASVALNGNNIEYSPPRFFVGQDSFTYTAQDNSLSQKTAVGTVLVNIAATQTFSSLSVHQSSATGCAGCHDGSNINAPDWRTRTTFLNTATSNGAIALAEPTSVATLLSSLIFVRGCGNSHTGRNRLCNGESDASITPTSASQLNAQGQAILRWLEEGGLNN